MAFSNKDYYELLGVSSDATQEEIRRAFQKKARTLHPDVNKEPGAEEKFKEVSEAYAVLSDAQKRSRYDAMRSGNPFGAAGSASGYPGYGAPGGYGSGSYGTGTSGSPFGRGGMGGFGDFFGGDPFSTVWRSATSRTQPKRSYNPQRGADVQISVELNAEDARKGCSRTITVELFETCATCAGSGSISHAHACTCPTCHGNGSIAVDISMIFGLGVMQVTCPECDGTGEILEDPCGDCAGTGRVSHIKKISFDIPAHAHDGKRIVLSKQGHAGTNGEPAGDLIVIVSVPDEHVSARAAAGFRYVGWAVAFGLLIALAHMPLSWLGLVFFFLGVGLYQIIGSQPKANIYWLYQGLKHVGSGVANAALVALLLFSLYMCTAW